MAKKSITITWDEKCISFSSQDDIKLPKLELMGILEVVKMLLFQTGGEIYEQERNTQIRS